MVGGGIRKEETAVINSTNVFAALGTLRKKKKKNKDSESSSSRNQQQEKEGKEAEEAQVFWAPPQLNAKSWADVEDEDDDDFHATTAPPLSGWGVNDAAMADDDELKVKESSAPFEGLESEEEGIDELDDDNEEEHEHESEPEALNDNEPVAEKPAEVVEPKESERQLSKKELKKKELEELEAMLAEFGYSKPERQDSHGGRQDKKVDNADERVDKEQNGHGESKSARKKKKKDKTSKEVKEQVDQPHGIKMENGTGQSSGAETVDAAPAVDVKEKIKKAVASKKKKSSKEMDAAAKAAALEAAARNAKFAAAKKKEKNHYNQQPTW